MSWQGIEGHDRVVELFRHALIRERLANSFLLVGPEGIGKRVFALELAKTLLCSRSPAEAMSPCGVCPSCVQVSAGTHPDVDLVGCPPERAFLPLDLLIGDADHRMRQGLCHNIGLKPFMGGHKVAIIDDADRLNTEGANCLLKTLEEPPPRSCLMLIGTTPAKQLPTIRSRCQTIRFQPLTPDVVAQILLRRGQVTDPADADRLAQFSQGSPMRAMELADPEVWEFRARLAETLAGANVDGVQLGQMIWSFVERAGTGAPARRERARRAIGFAIDFFRQLLHLNVGTTATDPTGWESDAQRAVTAWPSSAVAARCLERSLEAAEHVQRNTHPTLLVECFATDLAELQSA